MLDVRVQNFVIRATWPPGTLPPCTWYLGVVQFQKTVIFALLSCYLACVCSGLSTLQAAYRPNLRINLEYRKRCLCRDIRLEIYPNPIVVCSQKRKELLVKCFDYGHTALGITRAYEHRPYPGIQNRTHLGRRNHF